MHWFTVCIPCTSLIFWILRCIGRVTYDSQIQQSWYLGKTFQTKSISQSRHLPCRKKQIRGTHPQANTAYHHVIMLDICSEITLFLGSLAWWWCLSNPKINLKSGLKPMRKRWVRAAWEGVCYVWSPCVYIYIHILFTSKKYLAMYIYICMKIWKI